MRALNVIDQDDYEDKSVVENIHLIMGLQNLSVQYILRHSTFKNVPIWMHALASSLYININLIMTKTISLKSYAHR